MKTIRYIFSLLIVIGFPCGRAVSAPPQLDVKCGNLTCKVGEEVVFTISGDAPEIHFYSGEKGARYEYRNDGEKIKIKKVRVSFESQLSNLKTTPHRWILISHDFDGRQRDKSAIEAATWTDITFRFTLPVNNDATQSGWVDLTKYAKMGPFHFAFRYINEEYPIATRPPSWRIYKFRIWGTLENGEEITLGEVSAGPHSAHFVAYDFQAEDGLGYNRVGPNYLRMEPTDKTAPLAFHEVWITSKAIDGREFEIPSETGIVLQCPCGEPVREHRHAFAQAGQYATAFVGIDPVTKQQIVKNLTVTVHNK